MAGGATTAAKLKLVERRALVVDLRVQGGSLRDIAAQLRSLPEDDRERLGVTEKYNDSLAHNDLMAELKRYNARAAEGIVEVRRLELERLDALLASWWERAQNDPLAFDKVLTLMNRRSLYLGLDAPVKQEHSGEVVQVSMTLAEWQKQRDERRQAVKEAEALAGVG